MFFDPDLWYTWLCLLQMDILMRFPGWTAKTDDYEWVWSVVTMLSFSCSRHVSPFQSEFGARQRRVTMISVLGKVVSRGAVFCNEGEQCLGVVYGVLVLEMVVSNVLLGPKIQLFGYVV